MGLVRNMMPAFPVIFSISAWAISIWTNFTCDSVKFQPQSNPDLSVIPEGIRLPNPLPDIKLGLWGHKGLALYQDIYGDVYVTDTCLRFSDEVDIDAKWKTAQSFAVISFVFGFVAMILNCIAPVTDLTGKNLKLLSLFYLFVTLCQGLTLMQLSSDLCENSFGGVLYEKDCEWSTGIKGNIAVIALYFGAAVACCLTPPKADDAFVGSGDGGGDEEGAAPEQEHVEVVKEKEVAVGDDVAA